MKMNKKTWFGIGLMLTALTVYVLAAGTITTQSGDLTLKPASGKVVVNGSVGVGTVYPNTRLGVAGDIQLRALNSVLRMGNGDNDNYYGTLGFNNGNNYVELKQLYSNGGIQFSTGLPSTAKMTITNNGNVGVGTTSPSERLDVRGNVRLGGDGVEGRVVKLYRSDGYHWTVGNSPGNNLVFNAINGGGSMRIENALYLDDDGGGRVGVGMTTEGGSYKLGVNGNIYAAGNVQVGGDGGSSRVVKFYRNDNYHWTVGNDAGNNLVFTSVNGDGTTRISDALFLDDDGGGRMGVGMKTEGGNYKLGVNGNVRVEGKIMMRQPDGDYSCCGPNNNGVWECNDCTVS